MTDYAKRNQCVISRRVRVKKRNQVFHSLRFSELRSARTRSSLSEA